MVAKVAINGFGRIGRLVLRAILESGRKDIKVVAINDLGPVETNAHLLRFDSVHGRFPREVKVEGDTIVVSGERALPIPAGAGIIHRLELPHGRFERRITLPRGRFALGRRELANGCLTLGLRKLA